MPADHRFGNGVEIEIDRICLGWVPFLFFNNLFVFVIHASHPWLGCFSRHEAGAHRLTPIIKGNIIIIDLTSLGEFET